MKNLLTSLAIVALGASGANAADGTWTNDGSSNWSTTTNWAGGTVADGAGFLADFSTIDITANRFVTLDSSRTIGGLSFRDTNWTNSGFNWNLQSSGGSVLTLDNTGGPGGNPPTISLATGVSSITTVLAGSNGLNLSLPWSNYDSTRGTASGGFGLVLSETTARLIFNANNTVSGALSVNGGVINTYGAFSTFGNVISLVLSGNSFFQNGESSNANPANNNGRVNRIGDGTATLTLGGASGAGIFSSAFAQAANTTSQTFAGLTVNAGQNILNTAGTVAGTNNLIFTGTGGGGYVRNTNGLLNIATATGFTPQFTNAPTAAGGSSVSGAGSDAILIGAILNGSNFIAAASGNVGNATYVTTLTADKNVNVTGNLATSGNIFINSLRLGDTTKRTVTIGASDTLTIASGGILLPSSMATMNIDHTITGGNLTSGQGDLWIYSASGSAGINAGNGDPRQARYGATIASKITGAISLTVGGGTAQILLSGANDYTGGTYLENGFIAVNADSGLGAASGTVTAVSGVNNIAPTAGFTFDASRNFVINSGALLQFGDRIQTNTIAGQISGGGQLGIGFVSAAQRLILTGDNTGFTGQYLVNGYLRADEGTGLSSNANLTFNGRGPGFGLGVLETSGSFTRSLGSGAGQVQWQADNTYGSGGFAAVGGALNVNIGGNVTPDTVTWGNGGYFLGWSPTHQSQELILGSAASTHDVTFQNSIALNGVQRGIRVTANGTTKAILSGTLSGNATSGINKQGTGTLVLTGDNTYQGATTVTAGTLQIGDGTTDGSISSSSGITNNATLVYNLIGSQSYNNAIGGTGSLTKSGTGTLTLGGNNTYTGATVVNLGQLAVGSSGRLNVGNNSTMSVTGSNSTGSATLTFQDSGALSGTDYTINVGNAANARAVLNIKDSSSITLNGTAVGANILSVGSSHANGAGAVVQSGGDVSVSNQMFVGTTGSGYYNMSGGNLTLSGATGNSARFRIGQPVAGALGVFQQSGGAISFNTPLGLGIVDSPGAGAAAGYGTYYMTAGTLTGNLTAGTGALSVGNRNGQGDFTLAGGTVNVGVNAVTLGGGDATATGILNINGGSLQANNIAKGSGAAYLSFAGGTLVANGNNTTFLQGLTRADIHGGYTSGEITYAGGATIDTNGRNVTIAQALLAPTGNGVAVGGFTPISGLIGAPYVQVLGTGTGATAQAIFDSATGTMTGIVVTNPGVNYTGTPTFLISGGGLSANQTVNATTFANTSGGLTKTGAGTLTLSAANTFTGDTVISGGTLTADIATALQNSTLNYNNQGGSLSFGSLTAATLGGLKGAQNLALSNTTPAAVALSVGNNNQDTSYSGNLTGLGSLTKIGTGTLTLSGVNTYTGLTTISAGTLALSGGNDRLAATGAITIGASGTLDLGGNTQTTTGVVTFTSGATLIGGTLTSNNAAIAGNNALTGTLNLGADGAFVTNLRLLVANGGTNSLTIGTGSTGSITFGGDAGSNMNYVGVGTGNGTLNVNGGTVNFNNSTVGTGNGYLNAGSNSGSATGSIVVNGGNLNVGTWIKLGGNFNNIAGTNAASSLAISNGTVTLGGGSDATNNGVLFMNGGAGDNTVNTGVSTLTLNSGGMLNAKQIQAGNQGTKTINLDGGTLRAGASSTTFLNAATGLTVNVKDGGVTIDTQAFDITAAAALVANGTGGLTKTGSGALVLSGNNTYTGVTTISAGTLQIGDGTTNGSIAASSNIVNSSTLTVNQASGSTSLNAITGTGNVTKSGAGSLTLSQANTIGGNLTLSAGTLDLSGLTSSLAGNLNISGGTLQNGTLTLTGTVATNNVIANFTGNATVSANLTSSTVGFFKNGSGTLLLTGTSSFSNSVQIANFSILGGGTLQVGSGGALSSASRVIIQGGSTLLIDAGAGAVSFGGDAGGTSNFVGVDSGVGNLSMAGGTLNFNTTNVNGAGYLRVGAGSGAAGTSNMTVSGGTVNVGHSASIGASFNNGASAATNNGTLTISGGTVNIGTGTDTATVNGVNGALYLKNNTAGTSGTATLNLDGGTLSLKQVIAGSQGTSMVNFNGGTLQARANSANFLDAAAGLTANVKDGGAMIDTQAFDITVGAALVADGTGGLTKFGGGTLILNQANTYSGGTTLNSGTLRLDHASAAGSGTLTQSSGASLLHLNATGTFANAMSVYNVKASETLTLSGGITVNNATFDVDDGDTLTLSGGVSGTGGVTKNGTGTLVLSGSNTFTGDTQVNAGTLHAAAANALGSTGNITVTGGSLLVGANDAIGNSTGIDLAGGTLEFSGNVTDSIGALTLSANSVIDLGTGSVVAIFADLFMGSYTLAVHNWTGTTLWNGGTGNNTDQIYFNRALGSGELSRISFYSDFGSSFVGTGFQLGLGSGFQYEVIPVPEPETWLAAALLLAGAGGAWARGRHRREG